MGRNRSYKSLKQEPANYLEKVKQTSQGNPSRTQKQVSRKRVPAPKPKSKGKDTKPARPGTELSPEKDVFNTDRKERNMQPKLGKEMYRSFDGREFNA